MTNQIKEALDTLTAAIEEDGLEPGSYAHVWFCNIKMPIYDELLSYEPDAIDTYSGVMSKEDVNKVSAKIANHLMIHLFQIPTNFE
jgi:hypothetical protein